MGFTVLAWIADVRNRPTIRQSNKLGEAIEAAARMPEDQKFFSHLERAIPHSRAIDISAIVMLLLLALAAAYLFYSRGALPS
jgi:hypothetical protein